MREQTMDVRSWGDRVAVRPALRDDDAWRRDRHDRKAWHGNRDGLRTIERAKGARDEVPTAPEGKVVAALTCGRDFKVLNGAWATVAEARAELEQGLGLLAQVSGNEYALMDHYGWYVVVYAGLVEAVAA